MANYGPDPNAPPPPQQPMQPGQVPPEQGYPPPQDQGYMPPGGYVPPQGTPPQSMPPQSTQTQYMGGPPPPPPRRRPTCLIVGIIVVVVLLVCGGVGVLGFGGLIGGIFYATQPVADAGNAYMTALRDGDYNTAFNLSSQSMQQEAGNAQGIQNALSSKQPKDWTFTSRNINNDQGSLSGTDTYKDGSAGTVDIVLVKEGNSWKVSGISLK